MQLDKQTQFDKLVFGYAQEFLCSFEGITEEIIERHINTPVSGKPASLNAVYKRLLESAQNQQMSPQVIGGSIGGLEKLEGLLFGFDPHQIASTYVNGWEALLDDIVLSLKPKGRMRRTTRSLWPRFCRTIISGAVFLDQFSGIEDFVNWVDFFDRDDRARSALPMLLALEIEGFGFTLACDFLKELGYMGFGKPDVHIKDIFTELGLCAKRDDYTIFKTLVRVAKNVNRTPYEVDKLFWLIGSGGFYYAGIDIGGQKKTFYVFVKSKFGS